MARLARGTAGWPPTQRRGRGGGVSCIPMAMLTGSVTALSLAHCHKCGRPARAVRVWMRPGGVARASDHFDGTPTCVEDEGEDTVITRPPEKDTVITRPPEKDTLIVKPPQPPEE